ncbi:MAG: Glu/Leu/Phe/Val dehydrogenase dimerization domain-containing protein, partial [Spirochaetota bacterium]
MEKVRVPADETAVERLKKISVKRLSPDDLRKLYFHLLETSDLSSDSILHEIENAAQNVELYEDFSGSLQIEDISFLISHNRYQEKDSRVSDGGGYTDIRVEGENGGKKLFLVSRSHDLIKGTERRIQEIIREKPGSVFRLSAFGIENRNKKDQRRLYILEEDHLSRDPSSRGKEYDEAKASLCRAAGSVPEADISAFADSASGKLLSFLQALNSPALIAAYIEHWRIFTSMAKKGDDIYIPVIAPVPGDPKAGNLIHMWLAREKFQENYETINTIFERRGLCFSRQFFDSFLIDGKDYVAFSTVVPSAGITADEADFLRNEIFSRLLLLNSAPVSVGTIRTMLDTIKTSKDYRKLQLIEHMQRNKQREYLVPLVLLLNDVNAEIRYKAFGLIKHYLLNPTPEMKNDYYWSTLKNIVSAATVPIDREKDRASRPLTDEEIIKLIKFRDVFYADYTEPVTGKTSLFIRISGEGIGKGGIRAHASHVSFSGEGALATNMLFKTLGLGIPRYTIGKGGILGDIQFRDLPDVQRKLARENILNAYADFLYYTAQVGPLSDVPAGDVGVGGDEIKIIFDRITENAFNDAARIAKGELGNDSAQAVILREHFGVPVENSAVMDELARSRAAVENYTASAITGKPGEKGLALRSGATGRGILEVLGAQQNYQDFSDETLWSDSARVAEAIGREDEYRTKADSRIRMLTFAIQGFGKVGSSCGKLLYKIGAKIKMISDISGTLVNEQGVGDIDKIEEFCRTGNARLADLPADILSKSEFVPGNTILPLGALANVIVPSALEDVITASEKDDGAHICARQFDGDYLLQGANGPATAEAEEILAENGKVSFPDILANSGGVLASYIEWLNGLICRFGYRTVYENGFVHPIVHN